MYRLVHPADRQELPLRMLFHPAGNDLFQRACEADGFRGLVAALLHDPGYETAALETRVIDRLRLADDLRLLTQLDGRQLLISDRDQRGTINVHSDEPFVRSLHRLGVVSLAPLVPESPGSSRL